MPTDKYNSIMAKATGLISSPFKVVWSQDASFHKLQWLHNACIMVLTKPTFVLPLHPIPGEDMRRIW